MCDIDAGRHCGSIIFVGVAVRSAMLIEIDALEHPRREAP
jgi:hypothetical protein